MVTTRAIYDNRRRTEADCSQILDFKPLTQGNIAEVRPLLESNRLQPRTCDFTVGGLFMWIDYFAYSYAVADGMLFIKGLNETDLSRPAYSLPCGGGDLNNALDRLRTHCRASGSACELSAVPEAALPLLRAYGAVEEITPMNSWGDYLYDIEPLATLSGKKMAKKRNHVNHFSKEFPDARFEPLGPENIDAVRRFFDSQTLAPDKSVTADYERLQVKEVLRHPERFGFEGAVLSVGNRRVVAFTLGEVIDDTLYVHIEKMDHQTEGSGECINYRFAAMMRNRYGASRLLYVNREDDADDEGLRKAKLSYHPLKVLEKYNVRLSL